MKNTTLILVALIGTVVSGYGVDLVITEDVIGSVNTNSTGSDFYTITDSSGANVYITNSSITAVRGRYISTNTVLQPLYALGTGGLKSIGAPHEVSVVDSKIIGSQGGKILAPSPVSSGFKTHRADGGNGMYLSNVDAMLSGTTVKGGNGGVLDVNVAYQGTSAKGGFGIQLLGTNTTLTATDSSITGGNGGRINNEGRTGIADGGAGIYITGSTNVVSLDLGNTTVKGGKGGIVQQNYINFGSASGGDGLLVSGGANVTINGGIFSGGRGGNVRDANGDLVRQADGAALAINGSTVTLAGGAFEGGILLESGNSTLMLKTNYTDTAPFVQIGGNVDVSEWYDGQMQDVLITNAAGNAVMTFNFDNTNAFNVSGNFRIAGTFATAARAKFDSGLSIKTGGMLDVGQSTVTAVGAHTESGSTVQTTLKGTTLGKILSSDGLTIDKGTTWIINDVGTTKFTLGKTFDLAQASAGTVSNSLDATDVYYVGVNGSAGWLGHVTEITNVGTVVRAVYGQSDINERLGVVGDSSEFGQAMADLTTLVPQYTDAYTNLTKVTHFLSEAGVLLTNGYVRTPEVASALMGEQSIFVDQIKNRTRSHFYDAQVGYPAATMPEGAGGWLRSWSDRMESGFSTDGMRGFSDRSEQRYGYGELKDKMDQAPELSLDNLGLSPTWQVWGRGYGSTAKQDTRDGIAGYDTTVNGGIIGVDKRISNLLMGVAGGYAVTELEGLESNDAKVDTGHAAAYLAVHGGRLFFDANANYGFCNVDTEYRPLRYTGSYDAQTMGLYAGGGFAFPITDWFLFTPDASILATYYTHDSYREKSGLGLPAKKHDSYDQWSPVGTVGATLTLIHKIELARNELAVQPELRGHYLHDFNAEMDNESYNMSTPSFANANTIDTPLLARDEDLYKIGAGISVANWTDNSTEVGLDFDYTFGENYDGYILSGKVMHRF